MNISYCNLSTEELQGEFNKVKEIVLLGLEKEGLLNGKYEDVAEKYAVVIHKNGGIGSMIKKLIERMGGKKKSQEANITFVKLVLPDGTEKSDETE